MIQRSQVSSFKNRTDFARAALSGKQLAWQKDVSFHITCRKHGGVHNHSKDNFSGNNLRHSADFGKYPSDGHFEENRKDYAVELQWLMQILMARLPRLFRTRS